jgi:hypothetical protein
MLQKIRSFLPNSKVIIYWDFMHIPILSGCSTGHVMGDKPGRNCTLYSCGPGIWTTEISKVFPSRYALNQLFGNGTEQVICGYPGLASYVPFKESVDVMVSLLSNWILSYGFDGIYLDGTLRLTVYQNVL